MNKRQKEECHSIVSQPQAMSSQARSFYSILSFNLAFVSLVMAMAMTMAFAPSLLKLHRFSRLQPVFPAGILRADTAKNPQLAHQRISSSKDMCDETDSEKCSVIQPLVVCGPSGVGKGTIIAKFMEEHGGSDDFEFTVSHTTRKPRQGEINGHHYHFTDYDSMKGAIGRGEFLEHAEVHGNFYGTSIKSLRDVNGKRPILDIDVQGVKNVKTQVKEDSSALQPKYIFISPPSMDTLRKRLESRGTETEESLKKRTENALAEMEYGTAEGNFDEIVVNDDLDKACDDFAAAVANIYSDEDIFTTSAL